ncbi:hypothetical protein AQUCO_02200303v1 [Aquilegia coerulea]|uniref:Glycolipid transfer protein domain-containing protein n=1 Tax=Aquilegia coerulea TaxID=218851 RepID=A0A2G5DE38_AQUCA|nr:hypothetical protein AQUCO_02200303v1 [Aquilegia coerulea]
MEEKISDISFAIEELSKIVKYNSKTINDDDVQSAHIPSVQSQSHIPSKPFLHGCNLLIQVLDKIGPTMAVLRQDVHQNIQRLEKLIESDPVVYSNLVEILKKEAREGNSRHVTSCTRAFVWLTRSMDFTAALLDKLVKDPGKSMEKAVEEAYEITLKPWHGWISTAAYKVALRLVPESKTFISLLMAKDEDYETLKEEIESLISVLVPILDEIHSILKTFHSDRLRSA